MRLSAGKGLVKGLDEILYPLAKGGYHLRGLSGTIANDPSTPRILYHNPLLTLFRILVFVFNKANNAKAEILTKMLKRSGSIVEVESGLLSEPTRSILKRM